ncbi:hypothetical protein AWV79_27030 [Cupriavidus sp. UYMMa02A]|nr:hypothetical protein AWV79_27030 [Cupriavidus sp. UYMMa02A]
MFAKKERDERYMTILNCSIENHPEFDFQINLRSDIDPSLVRKILDIVHEESIDCYLEHDYLRGHVFYVPVKAYFGVADESRYQPPVAGSVFLNDAYNQIGFICGEIDNSRKVAKFGSAPVDKLEQLGKYLWETSASSFKPTLLRMKITAA